MMDRGNLIALTTQRGTIGNLRHGKWRSRICEESKRSSAQQTEKNVERCRFWRRAFNILWMFMAATMNATTFMGENFSSIQNSTMNSRDLTFKHMFDITVKLVKEQDEVSNLDKIHWGRNSWKQLSLIGVETVINLQRTKVHVFSDSVLCFGKIHRHPESNEIWKKRIEAVATDSYRDYDGINGEPIEFEWNIFPGFTTLQLCDKVNDPLSDLGEAPETFTRRILFVSLFNTFCERKGNKEESLANARIVKVFVRKFGVGQWSLIGPSSEKYGILPRIVHKELGIILRTKCCWNSQEADILFSVQRLHCLENPKSRGHGKLSIHYCAEQITIETFASLIPPISSVFTEQFRTYVRNLKAITIDRVNLMYWWDNQLFSVKLKQKFFCRMKTLHMRIFYCNSTKNESNHFQKKAKWVNSVWKQDLCMLLKWDSISWQKTLVFLDNFVPWLVANTVFPEMMNHHNQEDGFKETRELDLY